MQSNTPLWIIGLLLIGYLWFQQQPVSSQPAVIVVTVVAPDSAAPPTFAPQPTALGRSATNALVIDLLPDPSPTPLLADTFAADCEAAKENGRRRSPKCAQQQNNEGGR